jgi:hypothetical protein
MNGGSTADVTWGPAAGRAWQNFDGLTHVLGQLAEAGKACDCDSLRAAEEERLAELEVTSAAVNHRVLVR